MYIEQRKDLFRKGKRGSNPYIVMLLLLLIVAFVAVLRAYGRGEIWPPFVPTPTPTRTVNSYRIEGDMHFKAGSLERAIDAYKQAILLEPENIDIRIELAKIQVYSSASLTTDQSRRDRLSEALQIIDQAKEIAPTNSNVLATRSFVLNWNGDTILYPDRYKEFQDQAEQEALLSLQLDTRNVFAMIYYAEVLTYQFKWVQATEYLTQAEEMGYQLMDFHRVMGALYEYQGSYRQAIDEYVKAITLMPNLTFLYNDVGVLYRYYEEFDTALEYFAKAANLNTQLGIDDPIPYMAIANTYIRSGDAMAASRNAYRALAINPYNADTYGRVGRIYYSARNYEGSIPALQCAVTGCSAQVSCEAREEDPCVREILLNKLPLSDTTVAYYLTYGSVLAGLHRPGDDNCVRAAEVFAELRAVYSHVPEYMNIVQKSEFICQLDTAPLPTPTPISSPEDVPATEVPLVIPTPTPTPTN
jgi:tetratricopeptide (TPR) repeat protein